MLDRNELKAQGIRFAQALQVLLKTVSLFSADHASAQIAFQKSFELLNAPVKETSQFNIGFVDQRVMLNNVLTTGIPSAISEASFSSEASPPWASRLE